jgi:hypothetical protein
MSATLHQAQADVGMSLAAGGTGSAFAVKPKLLFVEDGLEKLALFGKIRSVGSGVRPRCPKTAEVSDMLVGMYTP